MAKKTDEPKSVFKELNKCCSEEQFKELTDVISVMRDLRYEFLVVDLLDYPDQLDFIQTTKHDDDWYLIEIGLEKGGEHDQMFRISDLDLTGCIAIFKEVCVDQQLPNLSNWKDITDEIFPKNQFIYYMNRIKWFFQRQIKKLKKKRLKRDS